MTEEQRSRILQALVETQAFITREEQRSAALRTADAAEALARYKAHAKKLADMLMADVPAGLFA